MLWLILGKLNTPAEPEAVGFRVLRLPQRRRQSFWNWLGISFSRSKLVDILAFLQRQLVNLSLQCFQLFLCRIKIVLIQGVFQGDQCCINTRLRS